MGKKRRKIARAKSKDSIYDQPYAYICTPAYDGKVDTGYSQSLAESSFVSAIQGVRFSAAVMGNGAFIDLARNMFVKIFLEDNPECTHLFFIDSDLQFESRAMSELVKHTTAERPVTCGAYCRRNEIEDYPIRWEPHPELSADGVEKLWFDDDGWLMTNRVPTGFLCIRRNIIEEMAAEAEIMSFKTEGYVPKLFYTKLEEVPGETPRPAWSKDNKKIATKFIGEDFTWCDDYMAKYKQPISCWPDFDFKHGGYKCNYQHWLAKNAAKFEDGSYGVRASNSDVIDDKHANKMVELVDVHQEVE